MRKDVRTAGLTEEVVHIFGLLVFLEPIQDWFMPKEIV
jgi:hypothetical protein